MLAFPGFLKGAYSEEAFPWENENISRWQKPTVIGRLIVLGSFIVGFTIGYLGTYLSF